MWSVGGVCILVVALVIIEWWMRKGRWNTSGNCCNRILPPGSMGFPFIGETLQLLFPSPSLDLHPFIKTRIQRYGRVFKSSLAGRPIVISADQEFNNYILLQEGRLVELWYLDSFSKLFNQDGDSRNNAVGAAHRYSRALLLNHFGSNPLKQTLLPHIQQIVHNTLHRWSALPSIDVKHAVSAMIFDFTSKHMFGYDCEARPSDEQQMSDKFTHLLEGLMSFPVNIPGTTFHKCLKDQKKILKLIKEALDEKRNLPKKCGEGDLLDQAIKDMETEEFLTEEFVVQLVFGALFASCESIASALTLTIKLLSDHPSVVADLIVEHEAILSQRENPDSFLTWDEYKSMTFTLQVMNEVLRLANISPGVLRRALKDIQVNGYTIPAGWTIMVATSAHHLNPKSFEDPLAFNPWRWKDMDSSMNFMPFGGGMRQCAGAEFSRVFMATFIHVLVTKYRWGKVKGGEVGRTPFLDFKKGIQINVSKSQKN